MNKQRKTKQKIIFVEGTPHSDQIKSGESAVNICLLNKIKQNPIFKRKKWTLILDLLIENHYDDGTIANSKSIAAWSDVNYNTVWRLKNFLLEHEYLELINRNGLVAFSQELVLVKDGEGEVVTPKMTHRF
ncbi:hypothetical protein [Brucella thiophenivorans]|uniref:hypothetical protein n=1 Tax=Brucella thiophenivorans TaxID=571255 RepID=UPI000B98765F|nr:hypothetical protein [Brucella thiophenivorans]